MKKIILTLGALGTAIAVLPMFAAFEAHVINVTARIENALSVPVEGDGLDFGTVFPQEELNKDLKIALSQSFQDEIDADAVDYRIRQKPKCAWSWQKDGIWQIDHDSTRTGEVVVDKNDNVWGIDCGDDPTRPEGVPANATWGPLPLLCPYLSKHKAEIDEGQGEVEVPAFHHPWTVDTMGEIVWTEAKGRLAKSENDNDNEDDWIIDLKVPCFEGSCGQDWEEYVREINPNVADPNEFIEDADNEHKVFGCDLWIEVTGVSRKQSGG